MANDFCPFRNIVLPFKNVSTLTAEQKTDLACLKSDDCFYWDTVLLNCKLKSSVSAPEGVTLLGELYGDSITPTIVATKIHAAKFVCRGDGVLKYLLANFYSTSAAANSYMAIYDDIAGVPTNRLAVSSEIVLSSGGGVVLSEYQYPLVTPLTVSRGTVYWLAVQTSVNCDIYRLRDISNVLQGRDVNNAYGVPPVLFPGGSASIVKMALSGIT